MTLALRAQAVQLNSGEVLVGEILEATTEGLSFRRADTGGVVDLEWTDLTALHAARIKRLQGLVAGDEEEPMVEADLIVFALPGAPPERVVGTIEEQTATTYKIRRKNGPLEIKRSTIKELRRIEVPVAELYSPNEWYEKKLAEIAPANDPDKHVLLAEQMQRAANWDRAFEHLQKAQELGGGRHVSVLPQMLSRIKTLRESAAERDLLARIRVMRNRGEFAKADELIEEFRQTYPQSRIQGDFDAEVKRVEGSRERDLAIRLRQNWDRTVRFVAVAKIAERGLTLAAARAYAEEQMAADVFDKLSRMVETTPEIAKQLFARRAEFGKTPTELCTYGIGSWLLGPERVVAGTKMEGDGKGNGAGAPSQADQELDRMVRRLREAAERARRAASSRAQQNPGGEEETDEQWWKEAPHDDKESWLRAYFYEFGGQMEVAVATATACHNCGGRGTVMSIGTTGREVPVPCPVCHRTRFVRSLRVR
jgi:hypothetical protein